MINWRAWLIHPLSCLENQPQDQLEVGTLRCVHGLARKSLNPDHQTNPDENNGHNVMMRLLLRAVAASIGFAYGLFTFFLYIAIAIYGGIYFRRPTEREDLELQLGE